MGKKRITFYIDAKTHDNFKRLCKKKGTVMSKKVEMLIKKSIKK